MESVKKKEIKDLQEIMGLFHELSDENRAQALQLLRTISRTQAITRKEFSKKNSESA